MQTPAHYDQINGAEAIQSQTGGNILEPMCPEIQMGTPSHHMDTLFNNM